MLLSSTCFKWPWGFDISACRVVVRTMSPCGQVAAAHPTAHGYVVHGCNETLGLLKQAQAIYEINVTFLGTNTTLTLYMRCAG